MAVGSYQDEPGLYEEVFALTDLVFSGRETLAKAARLGLRWTEESTPFVTRVAGRAVSHVGVLSVPLIVDGRDMKAAGIHGVCTHPDYRGRGLSRQTMIEATAWCDRRFETTLLFTDIPKMYEPHGFRVIRERAFAARDVSARRSRGTENPRRPDSSSDKDGDLRRLDWSREEDVALLKRIARERVPVSRVLGAAAAPGIFAFNAARLPTWHSRELDAIVAMDETGGTTRIHDVAASRMPSWEELVRQIPAGMKRIELWFCPDGLGAEEFVTPIECPYEGYFMARGPLGDESRPRMLPRTAEF
jgi:GNAT superfamily N-acetyltransferase